MAPVLPSMKGLHALLTLSRAVSLSAAAETLGVTRSALSHRIADLEQQLGVTLVRTLGRRAVLTDDATALLLAVGDALDQIERAVEPLRRRRTQIRLSTVATFASHWLLPRLSEFQALHPEIELAISTTTRVIDLQTEAYDCAIRHGLGQWSALTSTLLFRETLVPVASASSCANLDKSRVIRARSRYGDWPIWWRTSGRSGKPSESGLIVETRAQALEAALAGAGVAMMDMAFIKDHLVSGRLILLGAPVQLQEGYYFVHRPAPQNERFVSTLRNWLVKASQATDGVHLPPAETCASGGW